MIPKLSEISCEGSTVVLTFAPAYIHRSAGCPGIDAGAGWTQTTTFAFADASVVSPVPLPCDINGGWLRIGSQRYDNLVPADGVFEVSCELWLDLAASGPFSVHGTRLIVTLQGQPRYVEEFPS